MDTQTGSTPDPNPENQPERAAPVPLHSNDPATTASSPNYGTFGHADDADSAASGAGRSGANDNPDEFSQFDDRKKEALRGPENPEDQPGHVEQNQAPGLIQATQNEEPDIQRKAWVQDDPRYAGGGTHNTREEPADANYPAKDE